MNIYQNQNGHDKKTFVIVIMVMVMNIYQHH
jgi:hypothetical protein